jgi:phosphoserine aminotransferase
MHANFTPGPSQLYFTVHDHIRSAMRSSIGSLSHRSKEFEKIFRIAADGLRELLQIPNTHHVFFVGSATEIWERSIQNLVEHQSFHFVNGAFSKRYFEIARQLGKHAEKIEVMAGHGFESNVSIPRGTELIAVTHNETSTGVSLPLEWIYALKDKCPSALLIIDAVSSLPYPAFDFNKVDSVFFSVQKGFGLPAGLGVWIAHERCLAKAYALSERGISIGSYHCLPSLFEHAKKNQTPETPNVLGLYLLGQVIQDLLRRGLGIIRKETEYKAAILYNALNHHKVISPFVKNEKFQSKTVVVADCGPATSLIHEKLRIIGLIPGDGYGEFKNSQLRFANFPTHSKEQVELLVDTLSAMDNITA